MSCISSVCLMLVPSFVFSGVFVCWCSLGCVSVVVVWVGLYISCMHLLVLSGMCGFFGGGVHVGHGVFWLFASCAGLSAVWMYFFRPRCGIYLYAFVVCIPLVGQMLFGVCFGLWCLSSFFLDGGSFGCSCVCFLVLYVCWTVR